MMSLFTHENIFFYAADSDGALADTASGDMVETLGLVEAFIIVRVG